MLIYQPNDDAHIPLFIDTPLQESVNGIGKILCRT
jgi:hypothetical protein